MSGILDMIQGQLGQAGIQAITQQIGAKSNSQTQSAIAAALPMIVRGLANNVQKEGGADALAGALDRDHDGSILDNLGGFLQQGDTSHGDSILGHVFGQKRGMVEGGVSQVSGLNAGQAGQLIAMVAPVVLGAIGKQKRDQGLDAGGLIGMLSGEKSRSEQNQSNEMGLFGQLLDRDGDGSIADDVAGMAGNILGNLFK
ncbi:MAG: DUF937 domain-containing protein [Bacteroidia bacterium]|nr:DUF937 domain-containing protein [Bacteroidia bacterium]